MGGGLSDDGKRLDPNGQPGTAHPHGARCLGPSCCGQHRFEGVRRPKPSDRWSGPSRGPLLCTGTALVSGMPCIVSQ